MSAQASAAKRYDGWGMEGSAANWHAALAKKSLEDLIALAQYTARQILPYSSVLEVAPGPGYFAIELAKLGDYRITGLDMNEALVQAARANAATASVRVDFRQGNVSSMPFGDETFDFIICRTAFKNFGDPKLAPVEMHRVLKPGGQALITDLRKNASKVAIIPAVNGTNLGAVNRIMSKRKFRFVLLKRPYTKSEAEELISEAELRDIEIRGNLTGLEMLPSNDREAA